ncbi:MAG: DUF2306 domain-containing protein [Hyphomicrobium sp.]|uniref:DUF2306 domain-containing protein n=1 Tax=Hyphomicrobium sp. CS1BSMeth3 TaxID=1892844 RepID=UPI00086CC61F|nr:DUF2306 domain-containing protein [Hyphomicrobium sp. CS1BSMeth3]MBN9279557.1 DUF2306 domain-containing protein [Hyphomicrobium sp.]ODT25539.1 MAG: hypothetical protein ABS54_08785 [Hyphomicrobium sp. SCN 65-11]
MTLQPLLSASPAIQMHAFAAMAAFGLGLVQLTRRKGDFPHRTVGYIWVGLMLLIAGSSFWIHQMNQWHGFSVIHLLSIWVLFITPFAVMMARRGNISAHRRGMIGLYAGALLVAGFFTFMPGRIMHAVLFGG